MRGGIIDGAAGQGGVRGAVGGRGRNNLSSVVPEAGRIARVCVYVSLDCMYV